MKSHPNTQPGIVERIKSRPHDAPMPTEHLLDEAAERIEALEGHSRFLLERLQEFDPGDFDAERDFHGHVAPAIARLANLLNPESQP